MRQSTWNDAEAEDPARPAWHMHPTPAMVDGCGGVIVFSSHQKRPTACARLIVRKGRNRLGDSVRSDLSEHQAYTEA